MQPSLNLAARLLRLEQQLQAYQKLHSEELAELCRALDEYKRDFAAALPAHYVKPASVVVVVLQGRTWRLCRDAGE
jgi:hypothetical protein